MVAGLRRRDRASVVEQQGCFSWKIGYKSQDNLFGVAAVDGVDKWPLLNPGKPRIGIPILLKGEKDVISPEVSVRTGCFHEKVETHHNFAVIRPPLTVVFGFKKDPDVEN